MSEGLGGAEVGAGVSWRRRRRNADPEMASTHPGESIVSCSGRDGRRRVR